MAGGLSVIGGIIDITTKLLKLSSEAKSATSDPNSVVSNLPKKRFPMRAVRKAVKTILVQIKKDEFVPSIIVGIGRGGGIFGSFISYQLYHTPIFIIDREYDRKTKKRKLKEEFDFDIAAYYLDKVLLVAGEAHSGDTMEYYVNYLKKKGAGIIKTCVFYKETNCNYIIDYFGEDGENKPLMPWQTKESIRDSINEIETNKLHKLRQEVNVLEGKSIYIVRHGETDYNKNDVFIGATESHLNTTGEQQIEKLADFLLKKECLRSDDSVILSSDQERCLETSRILSRKMGLIVKENKNLRERNYGEWEGKNRQQIMMEYKDEYEKYEKDPLSSCPPGADPLLKIIDNLYQVINEIEKLDGDKKKDDNSETMGGKKTKKIVIVTHKTTGRLLLSYFTRRSFYSKFREIGFKNGSVSKFVVEKGEIETHYLNKTDY